MSKPHTTGTTTINSPKSPLLAVLLVTRTRAGPRLLLHYPTSCSGPTPFTTGIPDPTPQRDETGRRNGNTAGDDANEAPGKGRRRASRIIRSKNEEEHSTSRMQNHEGKKELQQHHGSAVDEDASHDDNANEAGPCGKGREQLAAASASPFTTPQSQHSHNTALPKHIPFETPSPQSAQPANNQTWTHVLSFPADGLAKLLAPSMRRSWHKRRLEVSLGGLGFISCPVYEKEEGGWAGKKERQGRSHEREGQNPKDRANENGDDEGRSHEMEAVQQSLSSSTEMDSLMTSTTAITATPSRDIATATPIPWASQTQSPTTIPTSPSMAADASTSFATTTTATSSNLSSSPPHNTPTATPDALTMFNIVFVLAPSTTSEHSLESAKVSDVSIDDVYIHCAKKLAQALQYRQKRSGFIWEDVKRIMAGRVTARESGMSYTQAWPHLSNTSALAHILATIYNGLVSTRIAHLTLGPSITLSLQLPEQVSTSHIPTPTSPGPMTPGLWLTTCTPLLLESESPQVDNTEGTISPHSAMLLLVPAETLIKEIAASPRSPLSAPLAYFIRSMLPTKTLQQMSRKSRLSLANMQVLSLHLIHWRRARAVSPLHHTNMYIVSPLADWAELESATVAFRARFTALPNLPSMLARLSAPTPGKAPQAWGRLMPSPDHKEAYMEMLEWLVKGAWVTQLKTFAWITVSKSVKVEVARKTKYEERNAANPTAVDESEEGETDEIVSRNGSGMSKRRQSSQGSASLLSPRLKPHLFQSARRSSDAGSFASVSTTLRIPLRPNTRLDPLAAAHPKPSRTHRLSDSSVRSKILLDEKTLEASDPEIESSEFEPSLVISPHRANAAESRWLEHIGAALPDADVLELWPRLLKYFDGKHALEEIAVREGLKRKVVSPVLAKLMGDDGVLKIVRHW